jgi:hypothetical protein
VNSRKTQPDLPQSPQKAGIPAATGRAIAAGCRGIAPATACDALLSTGCFETVEAVAAGPAAKNIAIMPIGYPA